MTKAYHSQVPCEHCGKLTAGCNVEDGMNWIRWNKRLDSETFGLTVVDIDGVLYHRTRDFNQLSLIEMKRGTLEPDKSQRVIYRMLHQALTAYDGRPLAGYGDELPLEYFGAHLMQCEGAALYGGQGATINGKCLTDSQLIKLLRFDYPANRSRAFSECWHNASRTHTAEPPIP